MKPKKMIRVLVKEPFKVARWQVITYDLKTLRGLVGGRIEHTRLASDLAVISDEEMLCKASRYNCTISGIQFFGTIVLAGVDGEELTDLPFEVDYGTLLPQLWRSGHGDEG